VQDRRMRLKDVCTHVADAPPVVIRIRDVRPLLHRWHGHCTRSRCSCDMQQCFGRGGAHAQQAATCGPPRAGRAASHGYRLPAGVRAQRVRRKGVVSAPAWSSALQHVSLCRRERRTSDSEPSSASNRQANGKAERMCVLHKTTVHNRQRSTRSTLPRSSHVQVQDDAKTYSYMRKAPHTPRTYALRATKSRTPHVPTERCS
jgi:hypothetical protein